MDTIEAIVARQERAALSSTITAADVIPGVRACVWRCAEQHARKGNPKLGQAVRVSNGGTLFLSRIPWLPSDELTLRPWERDFYTGEGVLPEWLGDEALLTDWLRSVDQWSSGSPSLSERWMRKRKAWAIRTVVMPSDPPSGVVGCWLRCPEHPASPRLLTTSEVFAATR